MKELNQTKVTKNMWSHIGHQFQLYFSYPDVIIYIVDEKECEQLSFALSLSRTSKS